MPDFAAIFALIESKKKHNFPWKRQESYPQPHYVYNEDSTSPKLWKPCKNIDASIPSKAITTLEVLSWNIDFMLPFPDERMLVALRHLESLVSRSPDPSIIFLNECLESDLKLIQAQAWIQEGYYTTDLDSTYWESGYYGTCTLIPKSLSIIQVFRVHYEATKQERDVLCVDVGVGGDKVVRVCNSHLESLIAEPPLRPKQVETAAKYMHDPGVLGSVMGGDFNAIQPFDRTLHADYGLKDAYLEMGGMEDREEGYTWGQMAAVWQREKFGCSRMDKLYFTGTLKVQSFERFGLGLGVGVDEIERALVEKEGLDGGWITDHAGIKGIFSIIGKEDQSFPSSKI
jgi:tyrosyl-DNA phosphodiesterase 2